MSYDMVIADEWFNYTYNVSGMFYKQYPDKGIRTIDGMTGTEAIEPLRNILCYMINNPEEMRTFEPENGWGCYEGAMDFVFDMVRASLRYPDDTWDCADR